MVGTITVISQEAAQVLESAGEGPLGKNILAYFIKLLRVLFYLILSGCDLELEMQAAVMLYTYTASRIDSNFLFVLSKKDRCIF